MKVIFDFFFTQPWKVLEVEVKLASENELGNFYPFLRCTAVLMVLDVYLILFQNLPSF